VLAPRKEAYVHATRHPYYALTGPDGAFEIRNIPPGEYRLVAWHEGVRQRFVRPEAEEPIVVERAVKVQVGKDTVIQVDLGDSRATSG
jgi:hypothetical protein